MDKLLARARAAASEWRLAGGTLLVSVAAVAIAAILFIPTRQTISAPPGPPEAIVEGFVRELAAHQFERALPYLSKRLLAQTIPMTLEVRAGELEQRTGRLDSVKGALRWLIGRRAYAVAECGTERSGTLGLGFGLVLEDDDAWRIDELYELGWRPPGLTP